MPLQSGAHLGNNCYFCFPNNQFFMKKGLQIVSILTILLTLQSCYLFKAIKYKDFNLKSLSDFDTDTIKASTKPFHFIDAKQPFYLKTFLDTNLANSNSFSFLVIRNDSILYEN